MRTKEEIRVRINAYRDLRDKYRASFNEGHFSESASINYAHINSRLGELRWVLANNSSEKNTHDITGEM